MQPHWNLKNQKTWSLNNIEIKDRDILYLYISEHLLALLHASIFHVIQPDKKVKK